MSTVQESIDVAVPVAAAYNQWTQFESFPEFMGGVESVVQQDDTHLHWTAKVAGQTREFNTVITEQTPDERIAWKSIDGVGHAGVVTFHRLNNAESRVSAQFEWIPDSTTEKIGAFFGADSAQVKKDLKKFKDFVEAQGPTGAWRGDIDSPPQTGGVF
ncbi:SRPBCC family protein [Sinomonas sp. ASV486]|uniref:SRPBCC family protein n=1 Tax=Sinomonas puerhi TaxID=3238584 RepID=A0AB39L7W5_9MICC|nr:SRPBCC family protein [Sinomonas sp. ASV486]MDQ4489096.1 SRPBCC family protein [Sinomonas sp. ASV486]